MHGGSVHGISEGALFFIFASTDFTDSDKPLATMTAAEVGPFSTALAFTQPSSDESLATASVSTLYAFQTSMGKAEALRLHVPASQELLPVIQALVDELLLPNKMYPSILLVDEAQADLSTRIREDGEIEYLVRPLSEPVRPLYYTTKAEAQLVHPVLRAAIRFFWHLNRTPKKGSLQGRIEVEAHELVEDENGELDDDLRYPLVRWGKNLCRDGVLNAKADHRTVYGLRIMNNFNVPLHIWAFYFDCGDLSISNAPFYSSGLGFSY